MKAVLHNFVLHSSTPLFTTNLTGYSKFLLNIKRTMSTNPETLEKSRAILKDVFSTGVKAVAPVEIIKSKVQFHDDTLYVADKSFKVGENVYLVGFGKAVMGMATALEVLLGDTLKKGILSIPVGSTTSVWDSKYPTIFPKLKTGVIEYCEGGLDNQPDDRCLETTHKIIDLVESLSETDTLIVLISGGGSALLYMPRPVIEQDDKLLLCKALQDAGADIKEVNTVRKKLSMVKGGGLARMAYPASIISLILSDIVGDPIDLIASGPTVYDKKAPEETLSILRKYNLFAKLEGDMKVALASKEFFNDEPLLNTAKEFKHVQNIVLANNKIAIEAASVEALRKKITPLILRNDVAGNVRDVSLAYAHITSLICLAMEGVLEKEDFFQAVQDIPILSLPASKVEEIYNIVDDRNAGGLLMIGGGEATVVVEGDGKGGRNQELALYFSLDWLAKIKSDSRLSNYDVIILSAGTDGQDGPTDAAGAFGYPAIGPIIHDIYERIDSMAKKDLALIDAIKYSQKEPEKPTLDPCRTRVLSNYWDIKKGEPQELIDGEEAPAEEQKEEEEEPEEEMHFLTLQRMEVERMLPENALKNNDSYNFYSRFKKGADLLKTGLTGTNVMDLHLIYIRKRNCSCKVDFTESSKTENVLDAHDLHIDPSTIEKYKGLKVQLKFKPEFQAYKSRLPCGRKPDHLNIKIIDDNLTDPCCRKKRKFPPESALQKRDLYRNLSYDNDDK